MSYFSELANSGISHYESQKTDRIVHLIDGGEVQRAGTKLQSVCETLGIPRTVEILKVVNQRTEAWASFHRLLLEFLGTPELFGIDFNPASLLESLVATEPTTVRELASATYEMMSECVHNQLERDDAHFIDIEPLKKTRLAHLIPEILETRSKLSKDAKIRRVSQNTIDISELFRSPHGLRLLTIAGYGARISSDDLNDVDEILADVNYPLRISNQIDPSPSPFISREPREVYENLFSGIRSPRREYLVNLLCALDSNDDLRLSGIRHLIEVGHPFSAGPLIVALESKSSEIVTEAARGIGLLGVQSAIPNLYSLRGSGERDIERAATIALARLGETSILQDLTDIIARDGPDDKPESLIALAASNDEKAQELLRVYSMKASITDIAAFGPHMALSENVNITPGLARLVFLIQDDLSFEIQLLRALTNASGTHLPDGLQHLTDDIGEFLEKIMRKGLYSMARLGPSGVIPITSILQVLLGRRDLLQLIDDDSTSHEHPAIIAVEKIAVEGMRRTGLVNSHDIKRVSCDLVKALGLTGSKRAIPVLRALAEGEDEELAMEAIGALSEIDQPALDTLLTLPSFSSTRLRQHLTSNIGSIFDVKAIKWLKDRLDDDDPGVRTKAIASMLLQESESAIPYLKRLIETCDNAMRVFIGTTIMMIGAPVHEPLVKLLKSYNNDSINNALRSGRMRSINMRGDFWA
ncbi:MAG: HEAT repeat domain-containing protein [Candidatus Thorarchaeota archaeon]